MKSKYFIRRSGERTFGLWHIRAMPDKSLSERLDDCEKFEASLQSELVKHSASIQALSAIARDLFVLCSGVQRTSDAQENAFKAISERLKHLLPPPAEST